MTTSPNGGWARPERSRKDHYFGTWTTTSLCGRTEWTGPLHDSSADQCQDCAKALAKTIPAPAPEPAEPVDAEVVEPDAAEPEPEPEPEPDVVDAEPVRNMRQENLRLAWVKAFADAIDVFLKDARADHLEMLVQSWKESGNKSFDVLLPNGEKVGTVSLAQGKESIKVTDDAALLEWAEQHEGAVITEVTPERVIPATTTKRVSASWYDEVLERAEVQPNNELLDPETGEIIPGVVRVPAPLPDKFSVRYEKNGRDRIAAAYFAGELETITQGTPLPALTAKDA